MRLENIVNSASVQRVTRSLSTTEVKAKLKSRHGYVIGGKEATLIEDTRDNTREIQREANYYFLFRLPNGEERRGEPELSITINDKDIETRSVWCLNSPALFSWENRAVLLSEKLPGRELTRTITEQGCCELLDNGNATDISFRKPATGEFDFIREENGIPELPGIKAMLTTYLPAHVKVANLLIDNIDFR